jgi:hypothetical protein
VTHKYTLVSIIHYMVSRSYPLTQDVSVYAMWTHARGTYTVALQLQRDDRVVMWQHTREQPFEAIPNATREIVLTFHDLKAEIPEPGRYEWVLLANDQELARYPFAAYRGEPGSDPGHTVHHTWEPTTPPKS